MPKKVERPNPATEAYVTTKTPIMAKKQLDFEENLKKLQV